MPTRAVTASIGMVAVWVALSMRGAAPAVCPGAPPVGYTLAWSDEFDGTALHAPNRALDESSRVPGGRTRATQPLVFAW